MAVSTQGTDVLRRQVAEKFAGVNGSHPMTAADDHYVDAYYVPLEAVCTARSVEPDEIRRHILAGHLPIPSYLRSDGTEVMYPGYFELSDAAGGPERLRDWFREQGWPTPEQAEDEWDAYLGGQYVCLKSVTPANIRRKGELVEAIQAAVAAPEPGSAAWLARLHDSVDALDSLEPPFTGYDVLRFGGPVSRTTCIDEVRERFPKR
jgi:hypothetical protein